MAGRLSFSIAINLLTENFKKGTNQVKTALRSIQMQVLTFAAALGAGGLGLGNLVSRFIDVSRETGRATTALKNVSGSMAQYADNQRYLLDLAKKYGLEINALTANYAKFTAAASISGMTVDDQRKVFESVSRACTAFGMSADDSNGVMLALSQMMSKGKISSEELRLQMGERLPVALQAMAKAAGTSVAGLDKLMKEGKLLSKEVLPGFADALNGMIPNVDTDNLETSINRLKNVFTELANSADVQGKYKALVDWLTGAIKNAAGNIQNIIVGTIAVISGIIASHVAKWWASIASTTAFLESSVSKANTAMIASTQRRIAAEVALEEARKALSAATDSERLAAKNRVASAEIALRKALSTQEKAQEHLKLAEQKVMDAEKIAKASSTAAALLKITKQRIAAEMELEVARTNLTIAQDEERAASTYQSAIAARQKTSAAQVAFTSAEKKLADITAKEVIAMEESKAAAAQAASVKASTWWSRSCTRMKVAGAKLVVSLKAMWASFVPMLIVSTIAVIVGKLIQMHQEAKRIKNIFSDYKKEAGSINGTQEVIMLEKQLKIMNDKRQSQENINNAQAQLQKMLGVEHKSQEELNKLVAKRVALLKETAKAEFHAGKVAETEDALHYIGDKTYNGKTVREMAPEWAAARGDRKKEENFKQKYGVTSGLEELKFKFSDFKNDLNEYIELSKVWKHSNSELEKSQVSVNKLNKTSVTKPITPPDDKKTPLQKAEEQYAKSLRELDAQKEIGLLTDAEYYKAVDDLARKMIVEARASGDREILTSDYIKMLEDVLTNPLYTGSMKAETELAEVQKEYQKSVSLAKAKLAKKLITEEEYRQALVEAATAAANSAISIENIGNAADGFIKSMQGVAGENLRVEMPKLGKRDTTFDYKKTGSDKLSEELDIWIEYRDNLKEKLSGVKDKASGVAKELEEKLTNAMSKVGTLEDALKLSQVREDIKAFSRELNESVYSGVKDIAGSADRVVSSFSNLRGVMDDVDATEWEKLMAIWNAMVNMVDSFLSIAKMIENITELTGKLAEAKKKEVEIETVATEKKVANAAIGAGADIASSQIKKKTASENVAANTAEGASEAGKSAAKLPFPWNIVAIGGAIAAAIAAFAVIPKFAGGGIVSGGPSSGDKILARVNAGEMILNQGQQSRLWQAIQAGRVITGAASTGTLSTVIRGKDIRLVLNNELKSQGKKPL